MSDRPEQPGATDPELPDVSPATTLALGPEGEDGARNALLDLATAAAGIGTFDWDLTTGELAWDDQLIELFGYSAASFDRTIESFNARLHPEDLPGVTELLQRAIDTCGDYEAEYRVLPPDGTTRWIAARGRALCDEHGATVRVLGAAWDISARRAAVEQLALILETMAVGFIRLDGAWTITHLNGEAEHIAGAERAELLGRTLWEAFPAAVGSAFEEHYRRAMATGQPVSFDAYYPEPLNIWVEVRAVPVPEGLALYFVDVTSRRLARETIEAAVRRAELVGRVTTQLSEYLDGELAVARLAQLVVPALADWCIVTLIDESDTGTPRGLRDVASWHADEAMRPVVQRYAASRLAALRPEAYLFRALTATAPVLLPPNATAALQARTHSGQAADLLLQLSPWHGAMLPLRARGRTVGVLSLFTGPDRPLIGDEDLSTAMQIAGRAGLALDNARLYRQQRELAEGLQRSLLTPPPEPDHVEVVVRYVPAAQAAQVGGDWYDAFFQPDGATVLVIGDVVGHDLQAAAAMGQIRTIVRALGAEANGSPADILRRTDQVLQTLQVETAATAVVARLEQTSSERERGLTRLRWSNAGHPPPLVLNLDGEVSMLNAAVTDRLLNVTPGTLRHDSEVTLRRGAVVLLYTDGLVERRDQLLDDGLERLQQTLGELAGHSLEELCDELLSRMLPENPDDDVAIVAVRLHPEDRPRPREAGPTRVPPNIPPDANAPALR